MSQHSTPLFHAVSVEARPWTTDRFVRDRASLALDKPFQLTIYMYIYIYTYTPTPTPTQTDTDTDTDTDTYLHVHVHIHIHIHIPMHIHMHIYIHRYTNTSIFIYIYICTPWRNSRSTAARTSRSQLGPKGNRHTPWGPKQTGRSLNPQNLNPKGLHSMSWLSHAI